MRPYDTVRHLCFSDYRRSEFRRIGRLMRNKPFPTPVHLEASGDPDAPWELIVPVIDYVNGELKEKDITIEPGQLVVWHGGSIHILWQKEDGSAGVDTYRYPRIDDVPTGWLI